MMRSAPGEPESMHGQWKIPCFIRDAHGTAAGEDKNKDIMTLEVHTVIIGRTVSAVVPVDTIGQLPQSTATQLNFGQMALGQVNVAPVRITNMHTSKVDLRLEQPSNDVGPFSIVNALRPLRAAMTRWAGMP